MIYTKRKKRKHMVQEIFGKTNVFAKNADICIIVLFFIFFFLDHHNTLIQNSRYLQKNM